MEKEKKVREVSWLRPTTIRKVNNVLESENCKTRSEFYEKVINFYLGYRAADDMSLFLAKALTDTLEGMIEDSNNRMRSLLFKWCVELNMACHMIAAHFKVDEVNLRELRQYAVDEVKRTYGQISFDHALEVQRRIEGDEWLG